MRIPFKRRFVLLALAALALALVVAFATTSRASAAFDALFILSPPNNQIVDPLTHLDSNATFIPGSVYGIQDFSFGVEKGTSLGSSSSGAGTGKTQFHTFTITKLTDRTSPSLFSVVVAGKEFPSALVYIRKAGATTTNPEYYDYKFTPVFVTKISWSGSSGDEVSTETVTFLYGALSIQSIQIRSDGSVLIIAPPPGGCGWSCVVNTPTP